VGRFSPRALSRVAAVGALVLALGLTGCGRKGGLDPPPAAAADPMMAPAPAPEIGPDGRPLPPTPGVGRTSPLDFLID
jgi:predicted small lipoprotein YifL